MPPPCGNTWIDIVNIILLLISYSVLMAQNPFKIAVNKSKVGPTSGGGSEGSTITSSGGTASVHE